ncbi:MAG TPA: hypothetical protein DIV57_11390, partial [Stenotrophomonas sp.]|nr:hypothetical protein [Stenotrophomonas sp.]
MEFDSISPAISGVMGGMLATSLVARWSRNLPGGYRGKSRQRLAREHRASIWTANALFFVGLFSGVAL